LIENADDFGKNGRLEIGLDDHNRVRLAKSVKNNQLMVQLI